MSKPPDEHVDPGENAEVPKSESGTEGSGLDLLNRRMRYPIAYVGLLIFSALDVILTWIILGLAGREVNPIAEWVIDEWGLNGMIIYKFALITVFILMCEAVGSLRDTTGRTLARVSVLIASVPVIWSLILLSAYRLS